MVLLMDHAYNYSTVRTLGVLRARQIDRISTIKEPNRSIYHVDIERVLLLDL